MSDHKHSYPISLFILFLFLPLGNYTPIHAPPPPPPPPNSDSQACKNKVLLSWVTHSSLGLKMNFEENKSAN